MAIKIAIADDHVLFRKGVRELIEFEDDFEVILEAGDGYELIEGIQKEQPDVVLMDLKMPKMDGIDATKYLHAHYPAIKIIVVSMLEDDKFVIQLMQLGASGYLLKNTDPDDLLEAIKKVHEVGYFFSEKVSLAMARGLSNQERPSTNLVNTPTLSERELEVLELICQGYTNPEIGKQLYISHRTVEGHRKKLIEKTNAKNTAGLVAFAFKTGLVR